MPIRHLAIAAALLASGAATAAEPKPSRLAPIESQAFSTHSPFESGDCAVCHQQPGGPGPGKLGKAVNEVCFDCHDEFKGTARRMRHPAPKDDCTKCHNPHNSKKRKLLL